MSLDLIQEVLGRPSTVIDPGHRDQWFQIEQSLGLPLPVDYKAYINTFGTGRIAGFIYLLNPFSKNSHLHLGKQSTIILAALRELRDMDPDECPYPIYPQPSGLFPWGATDNGDVLYWLMTGLPATWPIIVNESRSPDYEEFAMSTTLFLSKLVSGDISSEILSDCLDKQILFEPLV